MKKITEKAKAIAKKKGFHNEERRLKTKAHAVRVAKRIHGKPLRVAGFMKTAVK